MWLTSRAICDLYTARATRPSRLLKQMQVIYATASLTPCCESRDFNPKDELS